VRYADKAPFDVVQRIAARGLPVLIVVNRMPADDSEHRVVLEDLQRVLKDTALRGIDDARVQIVGIAEGRLDSSGERLAPDAAAPVLQRVDELAHDRERRLALARRALEGALAGLDPLLQAVGADVERAAAEGEALRAITAKSIPGTRVSSPNRSAPRAMACVSGPRTRVPISRKSLGSFSGASRGTGSERAAATKSPKPI